MSERDRLPPIDDCWNRIGVRGSVRPRCSRLEQFIHCRRCPVYADAAARLRDRPLPPDSAELWRRHYAAQSPPRAVLRDTGAVLVFRLRDEWLALPLAIIDEVIKPVVVHRLNSDAPGPVHGLASVHGRLRPFLRLASMLDLDADGADDLPAVRGHYPRMVVVRRNESIFVFAVDEVLGLQRFQPNELSALPGTLSRALKRFSVGVLNLDEKRIGLLDQVLLFDVLTGKPCA